MSRPVCLMLCTAKGCRRDPGFDELFALAAEVGGAREVACQDICDGPVIGIEIGDSVRWYERVRKGRHRAAVMRSLRRRTFDAELNDHEVRKHRNEVRKARKARRVRAA